MKKRLFIFSIIFLILLFNGCSENTDLEKKSNWDCTVACAEDSKDNSYIITYSSEEIVCTTGTLSIQNRNDFDIIVHLSTNNEDERVEEITAGTTSVVSQINKNAVYTVGIHADVKENTEIKCMIYDGSDNYREYNNQIKGNVA